MPAARSRSRAENTKVKPRSDSYVGLLSLSLLALSAAMLFAFLNWNLIATPPKAVQVAPAAGGARMPMPQGGPAVPPPGGPVAPGGGNPPAPPAPPQPKQ